MPEQKAISNNTNNATNTTDVVNAGGVSSFEPITSQEQLDKVIGDRLARERARYADYEDSKVKAAKFDEVEQASLTAQEKLEKRNRDLAEQVARFELDQLRARVAVDKNLPAGAAQFLTGLNQAELEASADKLAGLLTPTESMSVGTVSGVLKQAGEGPGVGVADQFAAFANQQNFSTL